MGGVPLLAEEVVVEPRGYGGDNVCPLAPDGAVARFQDHPAAPDEIEGKDPASIAQRPNTSL